MSPGIEDLIAENQRTYNEPLTAARAIPRDERATADLKGDDERMAKLAKLAEVEPEDLVDAAVRGTNVTFKVKDDDGVVSDGFFPLASLSGTVSKKAKESGGVRPPANDDPSPRGGTATVPTVVSTGENSADPDADPPVPPPEGVPSDINDLSGEKVAALLKDTPEGVDAAAVWKHEQQREGGPRTAVERAAKATGLTGNEEQPPAT